jgi:drug/metabolite transporter (DMT)-like permease
LAAVSLGFGAALCWGLADFLGGLLARRIALALVLLVSQLTAVAAIALVVVAAEVDAPSAADVAPAAIAGLCQLAAIAALYRALAIGTMSIISPVSASGAAALPVIVGLASGERPAALQLAGMAAALVGVVLACRTPATAGSGGIPRQALVLAAVSALGFGGFYVGMDAAVADANPFWALLTARVTAGIALAAILLSIRPALGSADGRLPALALIGLLDIGANACFTLGTNTGLLSIVSVLASLYPVATVVLARAVLGERLVAAQAAGVAIALGGVALIAGG